MGSNSFQFPRQRRLLLASDYSHVFKHCQQRAASRHMLLLAAANDQQSRLGLIIAKKHVRHATQRNRIKRIVREYFRQHPAHESGDFIVLARPGLGDLSNSAIRATLDKLWRKIDTRNTLS